MNTDRLVLHSMGMLSQDGCNNILSHMLFSNVTLLLPHIKQLMTLPLSLGCP